MGADLVAGGTSFRVWAPFATRVSVAGTFNNWAKGAHPLTSEGNGNWSAFVPGVSDGAAYLYVIERDVDRDTLGGTVRDTQEFWRIDPRARMVTNSAGDAIVVDPSFDWGAAVFQTPGMHETVIYELHVGSFNDPPGGSPGNFGGVIGRLDYLRDLGITHIEVMPSMEFATDFSWGYNPAHIYAIERAYGGPGALKELVRAAHERGLGVIFDVVYSHLGPMDLHLWRFDGWGQQGFGGIYFYNDWRCRTRWGDTRPDYGRPEVRQYLRDNALMWLEEFRLDGLRWDATAYIRNVDGRNDDAGRDVPDGWSLMQWINNETDARQPWKLHIAEDLRGNDWITRSTADGGAGFDTQWDSEFTHVIRRVLLPPDDGARDVGELATAIQRRFTSDAFRRVIYTESHDEVANGRARIPEDIWPGNAGSWPSRKRSTLGAALVFTAPAIPLIFQGQEFLEDEYFRDNDPLDWSKTERYAGIVALYRDLIRLRRNWFDTTRGLRGQHVNVYHVNHSAKVVGFHRWENGGPRDDVVVVVNLANIAYDAYTLGVPRGGRWRVRFNSDWNGYSPDFAGHPSWDVDADQAPRDNMAHAVTLSIGAYTALVLSQDE
jgi:1,4-alpha-glucan branching enzyme